VRFEVKYPESPPHEVELQGTLAVLGRDPSCDLVLNDVKCSRRHAVVEAGHDGIAIRDTGSANGVYVNGKKIERASLQPGDVVGIGDVTLTVLAEEMPGTLVMGPEEAGLLEPESTTMIPADALGLPTAPPPRTGHPTPPMPHPLPVKAPPAPPPYPAAPPPQAYPAAPPAPAPSLATPPPPGAAPSAAPAAVTAQPPAPTSRPLTVSILAALWGVSVMLYGVGALASLVLQSGVVAFLSAAFCAFLALVSGAMAFGLFTMKPWARIAQIVLAAIGLLNCPFTFASVATLVYLLRADAKARFANPEPRPPDPREGLFAALVLGTVLLGGLLAVALGVVSAFLSRPPTSGM
jgi:hypothetical protein